MSFDIKKHRNAKEFVMTKQQMVINDRGVVRIEIDIDHFYKAAEALSAARTIGHFLYDARCKCLLDEMDLNQIAALGTAVKSLTTELQQGILAMPED